MNIHIDHRPSGFLVYDGRHCVTPLLLFPDDALAVHDELKAAHPRADITIMGLHEVTK